MTSSIRGLPLSFDQMRFSKISILAIASVENFLASSPAAESINFWKARDAIALAVRVLIGSAMLISFAVSQQCPSETRLLGTRHLPVKFGSRLSYPLSSAPAGEIPSALLQVSSNFLRTSSSFLQIPSCWLEATSHFLGTPSDLPHLPSHFFGRLSLLLEPPGNFLGRPSLFAKTS